MQHVWRINPLELGGYLSRLGLLNNKIGDPNTLTSANTWATTNCMTSMYARDKTGFRCFYYKLFPTARPGSHNKSSITEKTPNACRFHIYILPQIETVYDLGCKQVILSGFTGGESETETDSRFVLF